MIKKVILEMSFFGVVMMVSAAGFAKMTPIYKSSSYASDGKVSLAMVQVPVPTHPQMEGKKVNYTVSCTMQDGILGCVEAK